MTDAFKKTEVRYPTIQRKIEEVAAKIEGIAHQEFWALDILLTTDLPSSEIDLAVIFDNILSAAGVMTLIAGGRNRPIHPSEEFVIEYIFNKFLEKYVRSFDEVDMILQKIENSLMIELETKEALVKIVNRWVTELDKYDSDNSESRQEG